MLHDVSTLYKELVKFVSFLRILWKNVQRRRHSAADVTFKNYLEQAQWTFATLYDRKAESHLHAGKLIRLYVEDIKALQKKIRYLSQLTCDWIGNMTKNCSNSHKRKIETCNMKKTDNHNRWQTDLNIWATDHVENNCINTARRGSYHFIYDFCREFGFQPSSIVGERKMTAALLWWYKFTYTQMSV